jgi:hypothetical protein
MSTESNKEIVRRYIEEVVDQRKLDILAELVITDCIIHRPETSAPIRGLEAFKEALNHNNDPRLDSRKRIAWHAD